MGIVNKYKVNELAKDFGMQTKQIIEILGKYFPTPKKSGQNLDEKELNIVFEYLTQKNQVSIQDIYADTPREEKPAPAQPAAPAKDAPAAQSPKAAVGKPQQAAPAPKGAPAPAAGQDQGQQPQKPQGENRRHDRQQRKDRNRRLKPGDKPDNTAPGEGRNARQDVAPAMSPSKRMLNQNGDNGN